MHSSVLRPALQQPRIPEVLMRQQKPGSRERRKQCSAGLILIDTGGQKKEWFM
jgi:hypothetical protein